MELHTQLKSSLTWCAVHEHPALAVPRKEGYVYATASLSRQMKVLQQCSLAIDRSLTTNSSHHSKPNPSAFMTASFILSSIFSLLLYSGNRRVLKQVWLVGSLLLSGPSRWMMHFRLPRPPIGDLQPATGVVLWDNDLHITMPVAEQGPDAVVSWRLQAIASSQGRCQEIQRHMCAHSRQYQRSRYRHDICNKDLSVVLCWHAPVTASEKFQEHLLLLKCQLPHNLQQQQQHTAIRLAQWFTSQSPYKNARKLVMHCTACLAPGSVCDSCT